MLTLHHNPCSKHDYVRKYMVTRILNLWALDGTIVVDREKGTYYNLKVNFNNCTHERYQLKSSHVPFMGYA